MARVQGDFKNPPELSLTDFFRGFNWLRAQPYRQPRHEQRVGNPIAEWVTELTSEEW